MKLLPITNIRFYIALAGIGITLQATDAAGRATSLANKYASEGDVVQMQNAHSQKYMNGTLAVILGAASIKALMDKRTYS